MRKNIILCLVGSFLSVGILTITALAQDFTAPENKMNNAIFNNETMESEDEETTQNEEIATYRFGDNYARYLEKYDEDGQGGFRVDNGIDLHKLTMEFDDSRYICWFRLPVGADVNQELNEYRNVFGSGDFTSEQAITDYLDQLLQKDLISFYTCSDVNEQKDTNVGLPYTESWIEESRIVE